jgi:site-specific recombinase XerD
MSHRLTMTYHVKKYLEYRRALGFAMVTGEKLLMDFARFADRLGHRRPLTTELALRWSSLPSAQRYRVHRLSAVRCFARYLAARDGRTEVPGRKLLGRIVSREQPHIYSDMQVQQLVVAAAELTPTYSSWPRTYSTLLGLLSCTGLRISEALKLTRGNVDLDQGILRIEQTKFRKSRLVPLHPTATAAMRLYAQGRDSEPLTRDSTAFFVDRLGRAVSYGVVRSMFRHLCDRLGLSSNGSMSKPRIHDLRHNAANRVMPSWDNHSRTNQGKSQ